MDLLANFFVLIWKFFFRTERQCFKKPKYTFHHMIETDGVSCSILMLRNDFLTFVSLSTAEMDDIIVLICTQRGKIFWAKCFFPFIFFIYHISITIQVKFNTSLFTFIFLSVICTLTIFQHV